MGHNTAVVRGRRLPLCAWRFQTAGLSAKSDLGFTEAVFALLPRIYAYRPTLSAVQFLRKGFAEQKMRLVGDVVKLVSKDERDHRAKARAAHRRVTLRNTVYVRPGPAACTRPHLPWRNA